MRLIDADKVEKYFDECSDKEFPYHDEYSCGLFDAYSSASDYIDSCETVKAEPIRHAYWIKCEDISEGYKNGIHIYWQCSNCSREIDTNPYYFERCPHCGAYMDELKGGKNK